MRWPTIALALLAALPLRVAAQPPGDSTALEDVTVTAGRISDPDWLVPLSIVTVTHEQIERAGIRDLTDLTRSVPGLSYTYARGSGGQPLIRGMWARPSDSNDQNPVGTLIDGIYISNSFAVDPSMLDLDSIEVLRGPQNALIGRNAFAGAILYQTAAPTETLTAQAQIDAGSDAYNRQTALVSGPLAPSLSARLAVMHEGFDGTVRNLADPRDNLGGWDKAAISAKLLWQGIEATRAQLSVYWYQNERDATPRFSFGNVPPLYNCGLDPASGQYINYCGAIPTPNAVDISPDARGVRTQTTLARLELSHTWSFATLTSLTGHVQTLANNPPDDWDLSSAGELLDVVDPSGNIVRQQRANVYFTGFPTDDYEWSEDLRLSGSASRLRWTAGLYWANNSSLIHTGYSAAAYGLAPGETYLEYPPPLSTLTPLILVPYGDISGQNRIASVFGSFSYAITPALDLSVDLRWSEERIFSLTTFYTDLVPSSGPPGNGSWPLTTPRATLSYRWPDQIQAYVSAAKGERSGGFNPSAQPDAVTSFGPDINWTYEVGLKAGGAGRPVQGAVAVYYVTWSNLQLDEPSPDPNIPFPITRNIGAATVKGMELSLEAAAMPWLDVRLAYAYADARFVSGTGDLGIANTCTPQICNYLTGTGGAAEPDIGGHQLPLASRNSGTLEATVHGDFSQRLHWYLRGALYGASREFIRTDNLNWLEPAWLPSLRLGVSGRSWEAALWGVNLNGTPRTAFANIAAIDPSGRHFIGDRANGASWGVSVLYRLD
jgi:iron complex outermembrane receptor protein